ncbi:MAG TPA: SRPBCC domain-containing protein [Verrucomicrobiae bacterium]|nr:SRPBCC domain-containing protein [Verrucomicrobiae bacterium]
MASSTIAPGTKVEDLVVNITEEIHVNAPLDVTFDALLEQIGPSMTQSDDKPMPMKVEPWPGGRWYRDLGDGNGHLWAHVQSIKRPTLLEFCGPLMMSYPAISNVQYRLTEHEGGTLIKFQHLALGVILPQHREGFPKGWNYINAHAKARAEAKRRK